MSFKRRFDSIKVLKEQTLYKKCLLPDIKSGVVFPAVRNNRMDFYYMGGKLFSFDNKNLFSTHLKYASVAIGESLGPYVTEEDIKEISIANFVDGYERIKENCAKHSGKEAEGVSQIYGKYSCARSNVDDVVVLDIEVSLRKEDDEYAIELNKTSRAGSDRMDLLMFDTVSGELRFFEAKHHSNGDLRARHGKPKIIGQMNRYSSQLQANTVYSEIIDAYKKHVKAINDLLEPDKKLPEPKAINPNPCLLIFGYDSEQKRKLKDYVGQYGDTDFSVYTIGNIKAVNARTLFSAAKKH